jgi:hypothetical protein
MLALPASHGHAAVTNPTPSGFRPDQIRHAYGIDLLHSGTTGSPVPANGKGQTIAIVDAYDDPTVASDLVQFNRTFGLPQFGPGGPTFTKVNQSGSNSRLPPKDPNWALEIALDVEWVHGIAPQADILLVEANSATLANLLSGVNYARHAPGVVAVSMSWGGGEFPYESHYDSYFTTPAGHPGITFVAAAGDSGAYSSYGEWPAVSPNVVSVGGTTLTLRDSQGTYGGESAWASGGGGFGLFENEPAYQDSVQNSGYRTAPDVALNADPNSGYPVYDTLALDGQTGWFTVGGTSAAAPAWAALFALVAQGRLANGQTSPDGATATLPALYNLPAGDFHQITTGNNGFAAGSGYDLAKGLGSPIALKLVQDLIDQGNTPPKNSTKPAAAHVHRGSTATGSTVHPRMLVAVPQAPLADSGRLPTSDYSGSTFSGVDPSLVTLTTPGPPDPAGLAATSATVSLPRTDLPVPGPVVLTVPATSARMPTTGPRNVTPRNDPLDEDYSGMGAASTVPPGPQTTPAGAVTSTSPVLEPPACGTKSTGEVELPPSSDVNSVTVSIWTEVAGSALKSLAAISGLMVVLAGSWGMPAEYPRKPHLAQLNWRQ